MFEQAYLDDVVVQLQKLKEQADRSVSQIDDEQFMATLDAEANSIGVIMKHVAGNMRSRWTDFLTSDGEKPNRNRDSEFETEAADNRASITAYWNDGWKLTLDTVRSLTPADLAKSVSIRGESMSVVQAINRQLTHYANHVGQITLLAKHYAGSGWKTLTIPRRRAK
jgi:Protein of unknown function (DUF1572)